MDALKPDSGPGRHRPWWRDFISVGPHNGAHRPALRVAAAITTPLTLLLVLGHPSWSGYAVFGAVSAIYSKNPDYSARWRHQAAAGLALTIAVTTGAAVAAIAPGSLLAVAAMALLSLLGCLLTQSRHWKPNPALFLVFAAGTISAYPHTWQEVPLAAALAAGSAGFGIVLGQLGHLLPGHTRRQEPVLPAVPLRHLIRRSAFRTDAAAHLLAPLLAGGAATMLGIGHPFWAAVSATVPMGAATLAAQLNRAGHRIAGTSLGLLLAVALLGADPPLWFLVAAVVLLQTATELFVARNYGIAVVFLTPLALVLGDLAASSPLPTLVADRFIETLLGIAVSTALLLSLRKRTSSRDSVIERIAG
ncbi:FUSC family protein [Actinoplanes sp. RD1]|uniref:FUSC family protein n=1 Tax=Actinoplanes sp. RD1 TaxID=3064538 RepID=UPI002741113A|nr:FUSC family protein [Actinoplanes sp. RD1]